MIIAAFASIASREGQLFNAIVSIRHQVDHVFVYLNGYPKTPSFLCRPRIDIIHSCKAGWRGSESKFYWSDAGKFYWTERDSTTAYFCCDDDIIYPQDYVEKMTEALDRHPKSIVGVHGVRVPDRIRSYYKSIDIFAPFSHPLDEDVQAHILGTGTIAFRPSDVPLSFEEFYIPNMADIWLALQARKNNIDMWTIHRPTNWLQQQYVEGSISTFKSQSNDLCETELLKLNSPWPPLQGVPRSSLETRRPPEQRGAGDCP